MRKNVWKAKLAIVAGSFAAIALGVGATSLRALPMPLYDVSNWYYDSASSLVAGSGITCNGSHWSWGDPVQAQPGTIYTEKYACGVETEPSELFCITMVDSTGQQTYYNCW